MAKVKKRVVSAKTKKSAVSPFNIYWDKTNYIFLFLGILSIILGFYLMSIGPWDSTASLVFSPILLFLGYVLIFPASILYRKKSQKNVLMQEEQKNNPA